MPARSFPMTFSHTSAWPLGFATSNPPEDEPARFCAPIVARDTVAIHQHLLGGTDRGGAAGRPLLGRRCERELGYGACRDRPRAIQLRVTRSHVSRCRPEYCTPPQHAHEHTLLHYPLQSVEVCPAGR